MARKNESPQKTALCDMISALLERALDEETLFYEYNNEGKLKRQHSRKRHNPLSL
ncbi:MAG: hypothetical protein K2J04_11995 [Lachnospiraceae bacterium]|nr:hypothetical protein [Lachnospiraceae bacterium]